MAREFWRIGLILALPLAISGQITVTASRTLYTQPDQAVIQVTVISGLNTGLDEVLSAVQSAGVTKENLTGLNTSGSANAPSLNWRFQLAVPQAKLSAEASALAAVQSTGMTVLFSVAGTQVSPQLQAAQTCAPADLIADAKAQAKQVADAAGLALGPIEALVDGLSAAFGAVLNRNQWFAVSNPLPGPFPVNQIPTGSSSILFIGVIGPIPPPATCSLTVKFGVFGVRTLESGSLATP